MKKLTILFLVLLLALTSMVGVTSAAPVDELTALAEVVPADAVFFAAIRTDDAYFETLDALLLDRLRAIVPEEDGIPADASFTDVVSEAFAELLGTPVDFDTDIRPMLGHSIALTIPSAAGLMSGLSGSPFTFIVQVADAEAAAELLTNLTETDYSVSETEDGHTLYTPNFSSDPAVLLATDLMIIGNPPAVAAILLPGADALRLNNNEDFTATLAMLPEDDYNIVAYINPETVITQVAQLLPMFLGADMPDINPDDLAEAVGTQALGFTILEDRSFVLDYAVISGLSNEAAALNLDLLGLVPAETPLLVQGQGFGTAVRGLFDALALLEEALVAFDVLPLENAGPFTELGPTDLGTFIRLAVEGSLMIDLDSTLDWMSGDFLTYTSLAINPEAENPIFVGNAMIMATDDPEATAQYVAGQAQRVLNAWNNATFEDGIITIPIGSVLSLPDTNKIASTDTYYISGTSDLVEFALEPSGTVLDTDAYAFESGLFLEDTSTLWYIDMAPLLAAYDVMLESGMTEMLAQDAAVLRDLLALLSTSSITSVSGDGFGMSRFTLTLSE